jgi:hypothetical protein
MNITEEKIAGEYKKMIRHLEREMSKSGVVRSVDTGAQKAQVQLTMHDKDQTVDVLLNATPDNDMGIIIYPKVDSDVVVCDIDGDGIYTIIQYGKIDKLVVKIGSTTELEVTDGNIVMNGGSYGGLVKVSELVDKIKSIENLLNSLINKFNAHTHPYLPGPGPTPSPTSVTATPETGSISPVTAIADIENQHVKH